MAGSNTKVNKPKDSFDVLQLYHTMICPLPSRLLGTPAIGPFVHLFTDSTGTYLMTAVFEEAKRLCDSDSERLFLQTSRSTGVGKDDFTF